MEYQIHKGNSFFPLNIFRFHSTSSVHVSILKEKKSVKIQTEKSCQNFAKMEYDLQSSR